MTLSKLLAVERGPLWMRTFGAIIMITALFAIFQSCRATAHEQDLNRRLVEFSECQANYNDVNNERTRALTEVSAKEREARRNVDKTERALFTSPLINIPVNQRTPTQQKQLLTLFAVWQDALNNLILQQNALDETLLENPVPPPPSSVCGRVD